MPGVESVEGDVYRRTISLDGEAGVLELRPGPTGAGDVKPGDVKPGAAGSGAVRRGGAPPYLLLRAHLPFWEGLIHVVERAERLVAGGTDTAPAVALLGADPVIGALVRARPGLRVPGAWGPLETAVQAVLAQECGTAEGRRRTGVLAHHFGRPVPGLGHGLNRLFPSAEVLASADFAPTGLPQKVVETVTALARSVTTGEVILDGGVEQDALIRALTRLPGLGVSTAHAVALRLGARDAFPAADPDVREALRALTEAGGGPRPDDKGTAVPDAVPEEATARWRPWRALAATHLAAAATRTADRRP